MNTPRHSPVDFARRASERTAALVHEEFKRGLADVATIAALAPLLGMVGGLIGIYYSFEPVGTEKTTVMANLFGKLANACVSVATGLLIGLISQVGYKYLSSRLDAVDLEMETATSDLVRQLKVYLGRPRQGPPSVDAG